LSDVSSDNIIRKKASDQRVTPNLPDIEAARSGFAWEILRRELAGLPGGGLNIAHEAVDRHAAGPNRDKTALRWLPRENSPQDITYAELRQRSNRFANVLTQLGAAKGESLFVLAGRIPELYVGVLGGLKAGLVATPLFSAFGPEPIRTRINMGRGKVLLTTASLYKRKIEPTIHDADQKELGTLMADLNDLVGRARAGSLRSSEMSDATITVTNLGDQGVEAAYGVIYPPQVALVGFGAVNRRPWVEQDSLIAMPCTTVTLSADHRVSSGHQGALFLTEISRLLQHPDTL
jgi:non-ribosomal peptide synthetase component F